MEEEKIVKLISANVDELKEKVNEENPAIEQLERILKDEKAGKNRKNVKDFLRKKIEQKEIKKDVQEAKKEIKEIKDDLNDIKTKSLGDKEYSSNKNKVGHMTEIDLIEGTVNEMIEFIEENDLNKTQMEALLEAEKRAKDRKTAKKYLKTRMKNKNLYHSIEHAKKAIDSVKNDLSDIEEFPGYIPNEENLKKQQETKNDENKRKEFLIEHGYHEEELEEESNEELEKIYKNLNKKLEILENLETKLDDDKVKEISLEELKSLQDENKERKKLIEMLSQNGMDKEKLESSTTEDLKKLADELDPNNQEKTREQIEEEAKEEVEMLRGAVKESQKRKEDEKKSPIEKLDSLKEKAEHAIEKNNKEDNGLIPADKTIDALENHRELDSDREKAIKTAQVMKAFLENRMSIKRELTYGELSENLEPGENDRKIEIMEKFFKKMSQEEYKGGINVQDMDKILDVSESLVEDLRNGST